MKSINVSSFPPPRGAYCHGLYYETIDKDTMYVSGQVAMNDDGSIPVGIEAQTALILQKIERVLAEVGLSFFNIVKINTYLITALDIPGFSAVRNEKFGELKPAATLVVVQALANPAYLVEIDAVAVRIKL